MAVDMLQVNGCPTALWQHLVMLRPMLSLSLVSFTNDNGELAPASQSAARGKV